MSWWDSLVDREDWDLLQCEVIDKSISDAEANELIPVLRGKIRTILRGDGVEIAEDVIRDYEAKDSKELSLVYLYEYLKRKILDQMSYEHFPLLWDGSLTEAKKAALKAFEKHNISFVGMDETFLFRREDRFVQLPIAVGKAIVERRRKWSTEASSLEELRWVLRENDRYDWRRTYSLNNIWHNHGIPDNSELDHACRLMVYIKNLEKLFENFEKIGGDCNSAKTTALLAYHVGFEHDALVKKVHEVDALRGKSNIKAASSGGRARASSRAALNKKIVSSMHQLIVERKLSASRAGQIVFDRGMGTSGDANRKIWDRQS